MELARLREVCAALPIFPLPRAVLLPGAALPLHVFEDRYRALIAHCLEHDRTFGIATLKSTAPGDADPRPQIWPEIGVGEITAHQPFPDGRCNIVLQYVGRAFLEEELSSPHPFRLIRGRVPDDDERGAAAATAALKVLVLQIGGLSPRAAEEARRLSTLDGMALVDALAHRLLDDPADQRRYLAATRLVDRVASVQDRLASFLLPDTPQAES